MHISEAKDCIKELYLNTSTITALVSERGVGKTSAYRQCAEELNIGYIPLYAAALEGPDFMGLPVKDMDLGLTRYLAPQFMPTKEAIAAGLYPDKGMLVLEEINRVPSDTISVLYPLLLENRINGHALGDGWRIGVTMNPDTMNYLVNALDDAMLDRFISIEVEPSIEDYITYSMKHHGNEIVLDFLKDFPDMLLVTNHANAAASKSPTPRGWTKVQEIINMTQLPDHLLHELIAGVVGPVAAASLVGYMGKLSIAIPSAVGILEDYDSQRAKVLNIVKKQQTPALTKVLDQVVHLLEEEDAMVATVDTLLSDLPDELQVYFYKVMSRDRQDVFDYFADRSMVFEEVSDRMIDLISR